MANDLVVQLGAKLDQFAKDMDQAGNIADRAVSDIESKFANLNPTMGGFGTAAFGGGIILGLQQIVSWVENANKSLADMQTTAKQVGLSLADFQSLKFAGNASGLSDNQFNEGLQKTAALLNDAQRNVNSLTKLFDANGISVKNTNGQLITENQLLNQVANMMAKAATEQDKIKIAEMVGLTREWVPFLGKGADAFRSLAQEAVDAGSIIDDSTIQRASEFDAAWKKSSAEWSVYMKSALASILPVMDDLLEKAAKLLPSHAQVKQAVGDSLKAVRDAGVPEEGGLVIGVTPEASQALEDFKTASGIWDQIVSGIRALRGAVQVVDPNTVPGFAESKLPARPSNEEIKAAFNKQLAANDRAQDEEQDKGDAKTVIPSKGRDSADAFDRAAESITKHTARTLADTEAQGKGAEATAGLRAETQLLMAAQLAGIPITDKVRDRIQDLAQDAGDAAAALAKAKVVSDTDFGLKSAFLTPADLSIAQQLRSIYGNDIPAALQSTEAAGLRAVDTLRQISNLGQDVNRSFLVDFGQQIRNGASAMDALKTAGLNALGKIADKLMSMAADNLWTAAFGGSSGLGGVLGNLFKGGGGAATAAASPFPGFASGTNYAPGGLSLIGEHGPELLNIPRGSQVIPNDVLRQGGGGGSISAPISISIDARGADSAGLARVEQQVARLRSELPATIVSTVRTAQKGRSL